VQRLRLVDEKIGDRDIRIAIEPFIEPLYELESNIVITAQEGLKLVREVDRENIRLLIDYYHLCVEKEDQSIIEKAKDYLQHMHLANSTGRVYPIAGDGVNYRTFISNLKKAGYDSRISIEAYTDNFAGSAVVAMAAVRHATR
jgi:D-psicose/D-tagatose/L-ribulose 3-epimerase